jgi:hypothetical protein
MMKIKTALRYMLHDSSRAMIIYYGVIVAINLLSLLISRLSSNSFIFSGTDFSSLIFIFVLGIVMFSQNFLFLIQNGRSRKTLAVSSLSALAIISVVMALLDQLIIQLFDQGSSFLIDSDFEVMVYGSIGQMDLPLNLLNSLITYLLIGITGLFLGAIYYRMTILPKILVSAGVPVFLLVILPIIDYRLSTEIFVSVLKITGLAYLGISTWPELDNHLIITLIRVAIVLFSALIYYISTLRTKVKA